ncbi:MAG TPA: cytochrome c peroxidase [Usitatibacter sp.]|jgi:cytochrome c peroxidase|nr:cytochrome c peroxidase [Usitatibacter sp.]
MRVQGIAVLAAVTLAVALAFGRPASTAPEFRKVSALSLESLGPLPRDPGNRWADDEAAATLGRRLFFDERLSGNGHVSCATCHDPENDFQDGMPLGKGMGTTNRRTMPIAGAAYGRFLFWDGRKDSLWAQALGPLESPAEHGGDRSHYARVVAAHYRGEYEHVFGPLPELGDRESATRVFVNIGKAIEAYERRIRFRPARFDRFVEEWRKSGAMPSGILDPQELAGLALFVGKADCVECHDGPLFTSHKFRNTGVPARKSLPRDQGRALAIAALRSDEFNCRSRWSDAKPEECREIPRRVPASERAFKAPSLRNVADRAPYMHAGQFVSLGEVLDHYNRAPAAPSGESVLTPLHLTHAEIAQLEAFLRTLSGGVSAPVPNAAAN